MNKELNKTNLKVFKIMKFPKQAGEKKITQRLFLWFQIVC